MSIVAERKIFLKEGGTSLIHKIVTKDGDTMIRKKITQCKDKILENEVKIFKMVQEMPGFARFIASDDNSIYMECYEGDLEKRIIREASSKRYLSRVPWLISDALPLMKGLLVSLEQLHAKNVHHNDIKPQNIFYDSEGNLFIGDFGHSRIYTQKEMERFENLKQDYAKGICHDYIQELEIDHIQGTYCYGAPENTISAYKSANYPISDIWSMGAVFFEMLTGVRLGAKTFYLNEKTGGLSFKSIEYDIYGPLDRMRIYTEDMNVEGFSIYSQDWKEEFDKIRAKRDIYSPLKAMLAFQVWATGTQIRLDKDTEKNILELFKGMLDPNPLTRLTAKECLANPVFK